MLEQQGATELMNEAWDAATNDTRLSPEARSQLFTLVKNLVEGGNPWLPPNTTDGTPEEIIGARAELVACGYLTQSSDGRFFWEWPGREPWPAPPVSTRTHQSGPNAPKRIYAIGDTKAGCIKIGISNNPETRLKGIRTHYPRKLSLLWTSEGGVRLEEYLHERFRRRRLEGEWFDFSGLSDAAIVKKIDAEVQAWHRMSEAEREAARPGALRPGKPGPINISRRIARDGSIDLLDKAVYFALESFAQCPERGVASRKNLAAAVGRSVKTVERALARLEERGIIEIEHVRDVRGRTVNRYTLVGGTGGQV